MISISHKGSFLKTTKFLKKNSTNKPYIDILKFYGEKGVMALREATPKDTGKTSTSWGYEIVEGNGECSIIWTNSNIVDGVPIAVILQYGHGTRNGGYVQGRDYINPAIRPIFDDISSAAWKEIIKL